MKKQLKKGGIFGKPVAYMHTIEWQKRGTHLSVKYFLK